MYRNRQLTLDGVFGYNQLLVNGVDVAPSINTNTTDINYIYNGALINTSAGTLNNAQITEAISSLTQTNSQDISTIKTTLKEQIDKQKQDVTTINSNINSQTTSLNDYKTNTNNSINIINSKISNIENGPSLVANQLTTLQTSINANNSSIVDLQTKNNKNTSDIITNGTSITNLSNKQNNDITTLTNEINTNKTNISNNTTNINNLTTKQTTDYNTLTSDLSIVKTKQNTHENSINNLLNSSTTNNTNIIKNSNDISALNIKVESLTPPTTNPTTSISTQTFNNLEIKVNKNITDISNNTTSINNLTTSMAKNSSDIANNANSLVILKSENLILNNTTSGHSAMISALTATSNKQGTDLSALTLKVNAIPVTPTPTIPTTTNSVILFSTDQTTYTNNSRSTPNTIGYQIFQNSGFLSSYPISINATDKMRIAIMNELKPLGSIWFITMKITCTGTVKLSGVNPTLFTIYDGPSMSTKVYEDWQFVNYKLGTNAYVQFSYYVRTNGQLTVQASTLSDAVNESYRISGFEVSSTRIA